jgi:cytochrome b involved in lipid metabolism
MGKGSDNKLSDGEGETTISPNASKPIFTWEEVRKHNKKDDCWIVVDDNVYNMTNFQYQHPGGRLVVTGYAGQDATVRLNMI